MKRVYVMPLWMHPCPIWSVSAKDTNGRRLTTVLNWVAKRQSLYNLVKVSDRHVPANIRSGYDVIDSQLSRKLKAYIDNKGNCG